MGRSLTPILKLARREPERALVKLYAGLAADTTWMQECTLHDEQIAGADEARRQEFKDCLAVDAPNLPTPPSDRALSLLFGLDESLFELVAGQGLQPRHVVVEAGSFWLYRRPRILMPKFTQQRGRLRSYMTHHGVIPTTVRGRKIRAGALPALVLRDLNATLAGRPPSAFCAHFTDGVHPDWVPNALGKTFERMTDRNARCQSILGAVAAAREREATIVVLPENTISASIVSELRSKLRKSGSPYPQLIVPGSYHRVDAQGEARNTALLLSADGTAIASHQKVTFFGTRVESRESDRGFQEGISPGKEIHALASPFGLLSMGICLDFCDADPSVSELWNAVGPEWMLVPSMGHGTTIRAHQRRGQELAPQFGTVLCLANQDPRPKEVRPEHHSEISGGAGVLEPVLSEETSGNGWSGVFSRPRGWTRKL